MPMMYKHAAIKEPKPSMNVPDVNAFLLDVFTSQNQEKPITCGFFRMETGKPLSYTYTYDEMKIIVEGEIWITDETGHQDRAVAGDVFYFPKGSRITFESPSYGIGFFCGQRALGEA